MLSASLTSNNREMSAFYFRRTSHQGWNCQAARGLLVYSARVHVSKAVIRIKTRVALIRGMPDEFTDGYGGARKRQQGKGTINRHALFSFFSCWTTTGPNCKRPLSIRCKFDICRVTPLLAYPGCTPFTEGPLCLVPSDCSRLQPVSGTSVK